MTEESDALKLVMDAFPGAVVTASLPGPPLVSPSAIVIASRAGVRASVRECRSCPLSGVPGCPVPAHTAHLSEPAKYVIVGEGPGSEECDRGQPFVGPSGRFLKALLTQAGLQPDDGYWMNVVSCWPQKEPRVTRNPSKQEVAACRPNLEAQLNAAYSQYVLLVGATALRSFRDDLQLKRDHGWVFSWMDKWTVMPIYHPAAILRDRSYKEPTQKDLSRFARMVNGGPNGLAGIELIEDKCVKCEGPVEMYDRDAVPYCGKHWERNKNEWKNQREKWKSPMIQGTLI